MSDSANFETRVPFTLQAFALSDRGRIRPSNEDRWLVDLEHNLFLLCDGIDGQAAGQIAAQAVVEFLPRRLLHRLPIEQPAQPQEIEAGMIEAVAQTSQQLLAASKEQPAMQGMGTTLALAWVRGTTAHLAHVGDSRIYLARDHQLTAMTEDHTILANMLKNGEIRPDQARAHPARGRLSRYLGMDGDAAPDARSVELCKGDRLLLCSDGLTDMVTDAEIAAVLRVNPSPVTACRALIGLANAKGGKDNITALVVNVTNSQG